MLAIDLATAIPIVDRHTRALDAARQIAGSQLPGLVVANETGRPVAVISAVMGALLVPDYILEDMSLAGVFDELGAEDVWSSGSARLIGELLDDHDTRVSDILEVDVDATLVEVAAQMADARAQVALLRGGETAEHRFVTLPAVMDAVLRVGGPVEGPDETDR